MAAPAVSMYSACGAVGAIAGYLLTRDQSITIQSLSVGFGSMVAKKMCDGSTGESAGDFLQILSKLDYKTDLASLLVAGAGFYLTATYSSFNPVLNAGISGLTANFTAAKLLNYAEI
jgi:ABC-type lipoprotein release transport system permease subunit